MLDVKAALNPLPGSHFLYGEGWDYGVVANNARFVQATQANLAGTGIGTFNDRLRDAVRGGSVFDDNPRVQGFGNGLFTNPNGDPVNGDAAAQKARLLAAMDLVKLGLTGNLRDYTFRSTAGGTVKGSDLMYDGRPAGYTAQPGEAVTYVDAHDNLALFDANAYKLPAGTTPADRARSQSLALGVTALSQGAGFVQAGSDLLRSKSFDGNSYDSGDWFNAIHWDCRTGNGFGRGLPPGADNQTTWPYARPLLADPALVPGCRTMTATTTQYQQFLRIKKSSRLFALGSAAEVQKRVTFPLSGTTAEVPGVILQRLDGSGLRATPSLTVIYNATPRTQRQSIAALAGTKQKLHDAQAGGADPIVKRAAFDRNGTFTVPAYTIAVFVQQ
ncbi:hypothetical protein Ahu01nite_099850 [Winogradskya humida]|uniref:Alpha-1,6-glucosidases pullulanase-type C-terminal domain-containing protein n=2 Tax=Winogradskya humida TaxID=113566 RepID=A0ABQ4A7Q6_9ACTN|nr:hypothetical protein Ahu01nite_099850 [Actinoplanes humidus]